MILVTGSAGFIGKRLCEEIPRTGIPHIGYDLKNGDDICDSLKLRTLLENEDITAVINLAALTGVPKGEDYPEEYFRTNVIGVKRLIDNCEKCGVKRVIHFSSSSVFSDLDYSENGIEEDGLKQPNSIYGITKLVGELLFQKSKLDWTIVRPFTVVGEKGRKDLVVNKWLRRYKQGLPIEVYGNGSRGYTCVEDLIEGTLKALNSKNAIRSDYNIGGDQEIMTRDLAEMFKSIFPKAKINKVPMPSYDRKRSFADTAKAEKALGWKHETDAKKLIKKIWLNS